MKTFISPNQGQTALTLQHTSGYKVPPGHNQDGYTNGGDRVNLAKGGRSENSISRKSDISLIVKEGGDTINTESITDEN